MIKCEHCGKYSGIPKQATHKDYKGNYWKKESGNLYRFNKMTGEFHKRPYRFDSDLIKLV